LIKFNSIITISIKEKINQKIMKKIILIGLITISIISCKKSFFDINDNPNNATPSNVSPDLILPGAMATTGNIITGATYLRATTVPAQGATTTRFSMLGRWLGIWSPGTNFAAGDESKYKAANSTSDATWRNHYDNINDYQIMETKASATGQQFYVGIAKIMKSLNYHMLVDQFGNVPYTSAVDATNIQPSYDNGEVIYSKLLSEITAGINLIKGAVVADNKNITTSDIMFKGNKVKWAKFGNTLKLRLLIHQSQVPGIAAIAATQLATITAEGSGFLGAGETASVNPGYSSSNENPYWTTHTYGKGCAPVPDNFNRANNFSLNLMKIALGDIRFKYFYLPVRGTPGTSDADWKGVDYAPLNSDPNFLDGKLSDIGGARSCTPAAADQTGLGKSPTMDSWIITSFESFFLQAEAITLTWLAGNAQTMYNNGVIESFKWLNIPNATTEATNYLAKTDVRINWPTSGAINQQKVIHWQKYIAFNGNNHNEIWNDYRRLGVVSIPLSLDPGRNGNPIPVRLLYPDSEYSLNTANAVAQGSIDPFTSFIFWDK
jgi:hypothetical protein